MSSERRSAFIQEGTVIKGEIRNGGRIEISGYVEGRINAAEVVVNESGKLYGLIKSDAAQINGDVQGDVFVRNLISIGSTGSVTGNIQYNQLRLDPGGNLSAQLHNVPPSLAGDFSLPPPKRVAQEASFFDSLSGSSGPAKKLTADDMWEKTGEQRTNRR